MSRSALLRTGGRSTFSSAARARAPRSIASTSRPETGSVFGVPRVFLSADGQSYVYSFVRLLDELFLVDGLR